MNIPTNTHVPKVGEVITFRRKKSPSGMSCGKVTFVDTEWVHVEWPSAGVGKQLMVRRRNVVGLAGSNGL